MASLLLDETNPRFPLEGVESQREAINALLGDAPTKIVRLAEDIVAEGGLNPTELSVVVEEDGDYVVIEGNRRLAALKLLANPDLADDSATAARFRRVADRGTGPTSMLCYLAESREDAKHWLDLRHTGENGGVGVVEWNAEQQNNFRRRRGSQADRASIFCDAVARDFSNEPDLLADIATVRRTRLTTLGRLLGDPHARGDLGVEFSGDDVIFHFDAPDLLPVLKRLFSDFAGKLGVSRIKSKEQRRSYIDEISDHLPHRSARLPEGRAPGRAAGAQSSEDANDGSPQLSLPDPAPSSSPVSRRRFPQEETVIFKGLRLANVNLRTSKLLVQSQQVGIDALPAVAGVMLRVVIECAVSYAVDTHSWASESDNLRKKIRRVLLQLDPDCENPSKRDKQLDAAWTRSQDADGLATQSMNAFVHNFVASPAPSEVRALSEAFRPMLERLDERLGELKSS